MINVLQQNACCRTVICVLKTGGFLHLQKHNYSHRIEQTLFDMVGLLLWTLENQHNTTTHENNQIYIDNVRSIPTVLECRQKVPRQQ